MTQECLRASIMCLLGNSHLWMLLSQEMTYQTQMVCTVHAFWFSSLVLITVNAESSSNCSHSPQAVRPQDEDNGRHVLGMLVVTHASFLPDLDIVDNTKIEVLEKEMEEIKMKYASLMHVVEGMLGVTHASFLPDLDIVDNTKIEALEKEMEEIKMKYASLMHVVEGMLGVTNA